MEKRLTREQIEAMEPGAKLDRLIAERVMGQAYVKPCALEVERCPGVFEPRIGAHPCCLRFSTEIDAAWEVVEKIRNDDDPKLVTITAGKRGGYCMIESAKPNQRLGQQRWFAPYSDNLPLAIARAALLSTLGDQNDAP